MDGLPASALCSVASLGEDPGVAWMKVTGQGHLSGLSDGISDESWDFRVTKNPGSVTLPSLTEVQTSWLFAITMKITMFSAGCLGPFICIFSPLAPKTSSSPGGPTETMAGKKRGPRGAVGLARQGDEGMRARGSPPCISQALWIAERRDGWGRAGRRREGLAGSGRGRASGHLWGSCSWMCDLWGSCKDFTLQILQHQARHLPPRLHLVSERAPLGLRVWGTPDLGVTPGPMWWRTGPAADTGDSEPSPSLCLTLSLAALFG